MRQLNSDNNNSSQETIENSVNLTKNVFQQDTNKITEKYRTLDISSGKVINNDGFSRKFSTDRNQTYLPPLMQITSTFYKTPPIKKRKLYNPNENPFCEN